METNCIITPALYITNFRVPSYVPMTLAAAAGGQLSSSVHTGELAKPILLDCDYEYKPDEDTKLAVRWFRNKEPEPFYQWLPEFNSRHLADWMKPLVNESFVSDPIDPLKRYRSLLIRRLSMNLTGQYTCLVSSLASQDSRQASMVVYQPPSSFTFTSRIFPAPTQQALGQWAAHSPSSYPPAAAPASQLALPTRSAYPSWQSASGAVSPTHFRQASSAMPIPAASPSQIWPPNNNNNNSSNRSSKATTTNSQRLVYTHDGRPVLRAHTEQPAVPRLQRRSEISTGAGAGVGSPGASSATQLHHLECHASQVSPRPLMLLSVKRSQDSIAQYLHESSSATLRPRQVKLADYYYEGAKGAGPAAQQVNDSQHLLTLYDITVSATIALNVSLLPSSPVSYHHQPGKMSSSSQQLISGEQFELASLNTPILQFKRGQRMSFECHLEITGTEFEQRKRININEDDVYQFAQAEEKRRRARFEQESASQQQQHQGTQEELARNGNAGASSSIHLHLMASSVYIHIIISKLVIAITLNSQAT